MKSIELFQWDLNKKIPCSFPEAHFACVGSKDALIVKANGGNVQIPNILLQEGKDIMIWMMENGAVADSGKIRIITRAKPADYVYTESEIITFETLVAKVEDVIAKANAATDNATTAAQKAEEAALKADAASDKAAQIEADMKASEALRKTAEQGRAEAEATRAANESKRTETFNTNLTSWNGKVDAACKKATDTANKAAQDAKTATDEAIAKTEQATDAAVAKADKATASATTAANKAEAAVAKLPLPLGNTLKGEVESTMASVHDAYPAPLVTAKVLGQSNQVTTTGKNLFDWNAYLNGYQFDTSDSGKGFWYAKIPVGTGKATVAVSVDKTVKSGEYLAFADGKYGSVTNVIWLAHKSAAEPTRMGTLPTDSEGNLLVWFSGNSAAIKSLHDTGVKVQVEIGTKATAYEPYTGGKPSPSPEYPQEITNLNKAEIVVSGKNILDKSTLKIRRAINTSNGRVYETQSDSWYANEEGIKCSQYAGKRVTVNITPGKKKSNIAFYDKSDKFISCFVADSSTHITVPYNAEYIRVDVYRENYSTIQLEIGSKATAYEPHTSKSTLIDLKGNELCSLPNGVKDEVVIDAEGNVSLIKRVAVIRITEKMVENVGTHSNGQQYISILLTSCVRSDGINVICSHYSGSVWTDTDNKIYIPSNQGAIITDNRFTDKETAKTLIGRMNPMVGYQLATPQIIQLGKVELPALPEATSNVWNNGNIPANVYIQYLKDVNIAYSDLENQIKQITAALSVIDTPTVILEMAWGTPAAI